MRVRSRRTLERMWTEGATQAKHAGQMGERLDQLNTHIVELQRALARQTAERDAINDAKETAEAEAADLRAIVAESCSEMKWELPVEPPPERLSDWDPATVVVPPPPAHPAPTTPAPPAAPTAAPAAEASTGEQPSVPPANGSTIRSEDRSVPYPELAPKPQLVADMFNPFADSDVDVADPLDGEAPKEPSKP